MRTWRLVSLLSILALVLAACGSQGSSPSAEESEGQAPSGQRCASEGGASRPPAGTLVFAGARLSASLDPALTSDGESFRVLQQVYEPLVDLAARIDQRARRRARRELGGRAGRHGVRLPPPPGRDVPRRDAVQRRRGRSELRPHGRTSTRPIQASAYYYGALLDGFGPDNLISSIEATDELTVTITLREPSPTFIYGITLPRSGSSARRSSSRRARDSSEPATLDTDVVQAGTGPFILDDYVPDDSATLVRNDRLLGRAPGLSRLG